jgi:hypothetical protein
VGRGGPRRRGPLSQDSRTFHGAQSLPHRRAPRAGCRSPDTPPRPPYLPTSSSKMQRLTRATIRWSSSPDGCTSAWGSHLRNWPHVPHDALATCGPVPGLTWGTPRAPQCRQGRTGSGLLNSMAPSHAADPRVSCHASSVSCVWTRSTWVRRVVRVSLRYAGTASVRAGGTWSCTNCWRDAARSVSSVSRAQPAKISSPCR